ncbi:MAG: hypothetical protein FJW36_24445 [Acidobacteria bacterium]|nr:hypothetical protein [Acidobacteriota bacterium]
MASLNLEMEYLVGASQSSSDLRWGYQGHAVEGKADYSFIAERMEAGQKVFTAKMNMSDYPEKRFALISIGGAPQKFEIPVGGNVTAATEWSNWEKGDRVQFRWRMH